jgi:hypothetical protein
LDNLANKLFGKDFKPMKMNLEDLFKEDKFMKKIVEKLTKEFQNFDIKDIKFEKVTKGKGK